MIEINRFQKETETQLRRLLNAKCVASTFSIERMEGDPEEYAVKAMFNGYDSWIYTDGAGVIAKGIDKRFEIYDYDSLDQLQSAYLKFIDELLGRVVPTM